MDVLNFSFCFRFMDLVVAKKDRTDTNWMIRKLQLLQNQWSSSYLASLTFNKYRRITVVNKFRSYNKRLWWSHARWKLFVDTYFIWLAVMYTNNIWLLSYTQYIDFMCLLLHKYITFSLSKMKYLQRIYWALISD